MKLPIQNVCVCGGGGTLHIQCQIFLGEVVVVGTYCTSQSNTHTHTSTKSAVLLIHSHGGRGRRFQLQKKEEHSISRIFFSQKKEKKKNRT